MDTAEGKLKRGLYSKALELIALRKSAWESNARRFYMWDDDLKHWWIRRIEQQAKEGLPMAVELMTEVTKLRMKS